MDDRAIAAREVTPVTRRSPPDLTLSFAKLAARNAAAQPDARPAARVAAVRAIASDRIAVYDDACRYLEQAFQAVRAGKGFAPAPGRAIVERMTGTADGPDPLFITALHRDERRRYPVQHGVNVAVYAVKMSQDLGCDRERQIELGMCGLLHDIGMARIPEALLHQEGALAGPELALLRQRPLAAFEILKRLGPDVVGAAECAAQVCERLDGSGYPRGLRGDDLQEAAKLIGLLDLYEALVHSRPHRNRLSFFEAMKYIFKSCKTGFERRHMKALLRRFTIFPVHSYVQLNSESIGRVLETFPDQPMRPKLQILFDAQRRRTLTERMVALSEEPLLNIVRCVSEAEMADLLRGGAPAAPHPEESWDSVQEPIL
jgi:HD-GYP domain-containing protein (c-di-GMP phosphodiesterase class II)